MALNTVTVTWHEIDAAQAPLGGWISFQLSSDLADSTDSEIVRRNPAKVYDITNGTGSSGLLVANDNVNAVPAGTYYTVTVAITGQQVVTFTTQIKFANGATQTLAFLQANAALPVAQFAQYLPLPTGGGLPGQVPVTTATGSTATSWEAVPGLLPSADTTGVKDVTNIQALLNLAGVALLGVGTFWIGSDVLVPANGRVQGAGRGTVLKVIGGAYTAGTPGPNGLKVNGVSHVTISDLTIDGNAANITYAGGFNYLHGGTSVIYNQLQGIFILSSDDVTVENCYIHDAFSSGIMAQASTNLNFRGNRLVASGDNQIYVRALPVTPYTICQHVSIVGNDCSGGAFSGIQFLGSSDITVTGNVCYGNGGSAAQGDGIGSEGSTDFTITGNTCYNNAIQGIQSRFTNEVGAVSQQSTNGVISGNICFGHASSNGDAGGIGINDTDSIEVAGNACYGNYYGININGGSGLGVSHVHVTGGSSRSNTNAGLRIAPGSGTDYIIENLYCVDNGADNAYVQALTSFKGGTYARAAAGHEGVHFASGSGSSSVIESYIAANPDNGILIDGGVGPIDIRDVWFDGPGQTRAVQEQVSAGPTTMINCKIRNQTNNLYTFNNAASKFQTTERALPVNYKPANPAGTVSTTLVMMGVGSTCTYTPSGSGLVMVTVTCYAQSATAAAGINCGGRYGTGTAPANGVAVTGTRFGAAGDAGAKPNGTGGNAGTAFAFTDLLTLTPGTAYWFDLALLTTTAADAASLANISVTIAELP